MTKAFSAADFKAVALDVDGTITGHDHEVRERAKAAIRQLDARGVPTIILTGRRSSAVMRLAADCGLRGPMVSNNGATVIDTGTGETLVTKYVPRSMTDEVMTVARELDLGLGFWSLEAIMVLEDQPELDELRAMTGDEPKVTPLDQVPMDDLIKLNLIGPQARLDEVQPYITEHLPVMRRSAMRFFESATPGATKLEGLSYCLDRLGIGLDETLGIADGENDIEFIERVQLGVATANAYPRLKEVADIEIGQSAEDATGIFLEELFGLDPWRG